MRRKLLVTCFLTVIMNPQLRGQSLWKLDLPLDIFSAMKSDTSAAGLRAWMEAEPGSYLPLLFLAYYHAESERELLLSKIRAFYVDTLNSIFSWSAYFTYQYIRGYLGDREALAGMDTVMRYSNRDLDKFEAVRYLAENGTLDYFDFLQDAIKQVKFRYILMDALVLYGNDSRFSARVNWILQGIIENPSEAEGERSIAASSLARIDKSFAVNLLNNLFRSTSGELRHDYFQDLSRLDPDGAAARSMYAIPREPDEYLRSEYIPVYIDTIYSRSFVQPIFLKFVQDWIKSEPPSSSVLVASTIFVNKLTPLVPSSSTPVSAILDSLVSYKHQTLAFSWLADANFVTELDANLESAHSYLSSGDSINCARQVRAFQEKVDAVYKDSLNPDPRKVTVEGWKFLYYNAQYILDRLPQIPPVQEHILSVPSQYATIQAAVNASRAGDVIEVSPGTYPERVSVNNRDSLILRTTGAIDQVTVRGFLLQQSSAITIKGFVVDATGTTEHGIVLMGGNNQNADVTIEACEIKNAGNDQSGIFVARGNPHTRIVNNRIHDNGRNGIVIIDATGGPHYVINNTIVRNGWNGVNVARQHVIYLVNNILSFNGTKSGSTGGRYGVLREAMTGPGEASGITLLNNLIVGNNGTITSTSSKDLGNHAQTLDGSDSGNYTTAGTEGTGVTIAPTLLFADIFVSSTDLHLKSGCFAINKGLSSYTPPDVKAGAIPAVDYEGEARPKGASVDVGADEKD